MKLPRVPRVGHETRATDMNEQWQQSEKLTDIFCFICDLNEYVYLTASRFFVFVTVSEVKSEQ